MADDLASAAAVVVAGAQNFAVASACAPIDAAVAVFLALVVASASAVVAASGTAAAAQMTSILYAFSCHCSSTGTRSCLHWRCC